MKKENPKTTKKATPAKSKADDGRLQSVEVMLRERVADGGATTDQLQSILSIINHSEVASPSAPVEA